VRKFKRAQLTYVQDDVEENRSLNASVDDSDLLTGYMNNLGSIILEEITQHGHVTS